MSTKSDKLSQNIMKNNKPTKCIEIATGRVKNAYHIEDCGAAHNKNNTTCIGNIPHSLKIIEN